MENTPAEAPITAPAETSVAPDTNSNPAPEKPAIDLGLSAEQAEKFKKFIENSGGFDNAFSKLKSDISTPKSAAQPAPEPQAPTAPAQEPAQPEYKTPQGAITAHEFLAREYFKSLAGEEKYASISEGILKGDYLKEMTAFGIKPLNQDGSINDEKVRMYLDLKAQTVHATPTSVGPNESNAPTVEYYQVDGDKITNMDQAYAILMQDAQLKAKGLAGHPKISEAEDFIKQSGKK